MIWVKTDAGRAEMQSRAIVKERAQRNLLLVIDGAKTEASLLEGLAGIGPDDFARLASLGLIAPRVAPPDAPAAAAGRAAAGAKLAAPTPTAAPDVEAPVDPATVDYAGFTSTLTRLISKELGLRGFMLTLAVEKASTIPELRSVAERVLAQIGERRGTAAAAAARRALYGD